jgi:hypothetical protein
MTTSQTSCTPKAVTADEAVSPGWPRRRSGCAADFYPDDGSPKPNRPAVRPTPWISLVNKNGTWDPWAFDENRNHEMREKDLCQVCGGPRSDEVFVLAPLSHARQSTDMQGGALCSSRCAELTAVVCPHYSEDSPIGVYRVPRHDRVDLGSGGDFGEFNDDQYDIQDVIPIRVLTLPSRNDTADRSMRGGSE